MTKFVQPLRSGQITIPAEFRRQLGIDKGTLLQLSLTGGELRIKPFKVADTAAGSPWMKDLYKMFAPVRREIRKRKYTDREIDTAIDKAIRAVRKKHAGRS
ncbi:AbrB/MazE/SpoVT family DNA-binding domain-containing protein [Candidatus Curtissbacteria bacterium]|nr:AbrB/MazE/SpoVT family DNA-binding domain-containing protein [Candidatus Curtissbacteria bacterium]